jgi:hypothetical protein
MQQSRLFDDSPRQGFATEEELVAGCRSLQRGGDAASPQVEVLREAILSGADPLGDAFLALRSPATRRTMGAVYTPAAIVESMLGWLEGVGSPSRLVDPGAGSGRFLLAAARRFPRSELIAIEPDPLAALMLRANAAVLGFTERLRVLACDYREAALEPHAGVTAFIGNPPYVRHHDISSAWKDWYRSACLAHGVKASALAGLHLHFFVQTLRLARPGDLGVYITAAEWLDVNYGAALRSLLVDALGGLEVRVLAPQVQAFPGTASTAAITGFRVGEREAPMHLRSVASCAELNSPAVGRVIERDALRSQPRWSVLVRQGPAPVPGTITVGELFRVHRGQVTGANEIWVRGAGSALIPPRLKLHAVTRARDLIDAGECLSDIDRLKQVVELPQDLDDLLDEEQEPVRRFLDWARSQGADQGYIARHRKAWWSVGLREPAPILCTYMGRRPPHFARNSCAARHINIAHGLYPRQPLQPELLDRIVRWLNRNVDVSSGRTYSGGLTKFEPRELERLALPDFASLPA